MAEPTSRSRLLVALLGLAFAVTATTLYVILRDARERAAHTPAGASAPAVINNPLAACADPARCERRCQEGSRDDCVTLGNSLQTGNGVGRDEKRAARLYERGCELDSGVGCALAGRAYEFAHGVEKSNERAFFMYERGCRFGDPSSCYSEAVMRGEGRGTARDDKRAQEIFKELCDRGSMTACGHVQ